MTWIAASRAIGRAITGRPEMLCAIAYRRDWRLFVAAMDRIAFALWREPDHCRNRYHLEHV